MPTVQPGESKKAFVDRCMPIVIREGTATDGAQAFAVCQSMWDQAQELSRSELLLEMAPRNSGRQYKKDVIRVGQFKHPQTGQLINVTPERLQSWVEKFGRMQEHGVNVPIYYGHDRNKPLGSVADMFVEGDKLFTIYDFADDDAVQLAKRAKLASVKTTPRYVDCEQQDYGEVIEHVAVTPEPVITRQGEMIALSRVSDTPDASNNDSTSLSHEPPNEEPHMEWLNELLGLDAAATEDAQKAAIAALKARPEPQAALGRDAVDALSEGVELKLSTLVEREIITPAVADKLKLALVGTEEQPNEFCLSRARSASDKSVALQVIDALTELKNKPATGTATGAQADTDTVELSRKEGADDPAKAEKDAEMEAMRLSMIETGNMRNGQTDQK
jgi:hypothetical protein